MAGISKKSTGAFPTLILDVRAPSNGASLGATILFAVQDSSQELAAFSANYSVGTGIYTVPAGGHKNVKVVVRLLISVAASAYAGVSIQINSVSKCTGGIPVQASAGGGVVVVEYNVRNLSAGDTVKVVTNGVTASSLGGQADSMQIFAS